MSDARVLKALWTEALHDFKVYAWGQDEYAGFAKTLDEHDPDDPIKPLPDRPHLRALNELYDHHQRLVLLKSRQMMVSWFFCTRILWEALHPGRRWLVCCRLEGAADALLERMWAQYNQIPESLRPPATRKETLITIQHGTGLESRIQAAAQNTDVARSFVFSGVWIDESAFTDNLADLVASCGPTTQGGGRLILSSTPNGREYSWNLLTDDGRIAV